MTVVSAYICPHDSIAATLAVLGSGFVSCVDLQWTMVVSCPCGSIACMLSLLLDCLLCPSWCFPCVCASQRAACMSIGLHSIWAVGATITMIDMHRVTTCRSQAGQQHFGSLQGLRLNGLKGNLNLHNFSNDGPKHKFNKLYA